jgi:hypothetical protein
MSAIEATAHLDRIGAANAPGTRDVLHSKRSRAKDHNTANYAPMRHTPFLGLLIRRPALHLIPRQRTY